MPSSHRLAKELARRLNEVAPVGILIQADGGDVVVRTESGICCREGAIQILDDDDGRTLSEKIYTATWQVFDGVQDCIVRELRGERWPAPIPGGLPSPQVRILDETVRFWFGDESDPVLTLPPIHFDEVTGP